MLPLAPSHLLALNPYVPGRPIGETQARFGVHDLVKLASNENPLGPSPLAIKAGQNAVLRSYLYPVEERTELKERICQLYRSFNFATNNIVLGNGSSELIVLLTRALLNQNESILSGWPAFLMYRIAARSQGLHEREVKLTDSLGYDLGAMAKIAAQEKENPVKLVFLANPNNPTGRYITKKEFEAFEKELPPSVVIVIDEAYAEYVTEPDYLCGMDWVLRRPRTVVLRTFSKAYGLAGLRLGYAICDPAIADLLHRVRDPFNVNNVVQAAAIAGLSDQDHVSKSRDLVLQERPLMVENLKSLGFQVTPSVANFVLVHLSDQMPPVRQFCDDLIRHGVIVRSLENYDLPRSIRVTIGTAKENRRFLDALAPLC